MPGDLPRACPDCHSLYASDAEFCTIDGSRLSGSSDLPFIGGVIGGYRILEHLGSGGAGSVYRARHEKKNVEVALKLLRAELAAQRKNISRFEREAEAARRVRHRNTVSVIDFGMDGRVMFLAMELLRGKTLEQIIAAEGAFSAARAARIGKQIASALAEIHRAGLIHRDVKPSNVMVLPGFDAEHVKLLDFGVVGVIDRDQPVTRLTREGSTVGTVMYMAPEQISDASVGPEADLYALGVVVYEMMAGRPPFSGSLREVLLKHLGEAPPALPPAAGLEALVARLLIKDPSRRPGDAAAVAAELGELAQSFDKTTVAVAYEPAATLISRVDESLPHPFTPATKITEVDAPKRRRPSAASAPRIAPPRRFGGLALVLGAFSVVALGAASFFVARGKSPAPAVAKPRVDRPALAPLPAELAADAGAETSMAATATPAEMEPIEEEPEPPAPASGSASPEPSEQTKNRALSRRIQSERSKLRAVLAARGLSEKDLPHLETLQAQLTELRRAIRAKDRRRTLSALETLAAAARAAPVGYGLIRRRIDALEQRLREAEGVSGQPAPEPFWETYLELSTAARADQSAAEYQALAQRIRELEQKVERP